MIAITILTLAICIVAKLMYNDFRDMTDGLF